MSPRPVIYQRRNAVSRAVYTLQRGIVWTVRRNGIDPHDFPNEREARQYIDDHATLRVRES